MTNGDLLAILKCNLQIIGTTWDDYLTNLIEASTREIGREGIVLDQTQIDDCNLIVMYASYLYRKRNSDDVNMPRMLRYALNNHLFAQKGGGNDL